MISNADGQVVADGARRLSRIVGQIANPVRWDLCMETMLELGVTGVLELPPAGTLTGIAKRGMKGVETFALKTPDELDDARALVEKHGEPAPSLEPEGHPLMAKISTQPGAPHAAHPRASAATARARVVPNADILEAIDSSDEWIRSAPASSTGAGPPTTRPSQMMSVEASRKAIASAGIDAGADRRDHRRHRHPHAPDPGRRHRDRPRARHRPGRPPSTSPPPAPASATAWPWPRTWCAAAAPKYVLVIGVERLSDLTDLDDRGTAFIFADGAGAVVVGPADEPGIGPVVWGSDGEQFDLIRQTRGLARRDRHGEPGRCRT